VVAVSYLSVDPAMRRWIDVAFRKPNRDRRGDGSWRGRARDFLKASGVRGRRACVRRVGVPDFARSDGTRVFKLDPLLAPLPTYLGALGITGLTAYFGLPMSAACARARRW
jgi:NADPH-dependent curcumin reductase CurA